MSQQVGPSTRKTRAEAFTIGLVTRLLRQAGAPEPWSDPDEVAEAADTMAAFAELSAGLPSTVAEQMSLMRRAQKAVDELRRVLPDLIAFHVEGAMRPSLLSGEAAVADHAARAIQLSKMKASLMDVEGGFTSNRLEKLITHWHTPAATLYRSYVNIVGRGSPSKGGPAARFVQLALEDMGYGTQTLAAVESALRAGHPITRNQ